MFPHASISSVSRLPPNSVHRQFQILVQAIHAHTEVVSGKLVGDTRVRAPRNQRKQPSQLVDRGLDRIALASLDLLPSAHRAHSLLWLGFGRAEILQGLANPIHEVHWLNHSCIGAARSTSEKNDVRIYALEASGVVVDRRGRLFAAESRDLAQALQQRRVSEPRRVRTNSRRSTSSGPENASGSLPTSTFPMIRDSRKLGSSRSRS